MNKQDKIKLLTEVITKEAVKIINEAKKKAKVKSKSKKLKIEGTTVEGHQNVMKDDVGHFYVVTGAKNGSTNENIMFETDVFNLAEKLNNGKITREDVRAIVRKEDRARRIGERFIRERESQVAGATKKAENLKGLRDEVRGQVQTIKKTQKETAQAVQKLREAKRK